MPPPPETLGGHLPRPAMQKAHLLPLRAVRRAQVPQNGAPVAILPKHAQHRAAAENNAAENRAQHPAAAEEDEADRGAEEHRKQEVGADRAVGLGHPEPAQQSLRPEDQTHRENLRQPGLPQKEVPAQNQEQLQREQLSQPAPLPTGQAVEQRQQGGEVPDHQGHQADHGPAAADHLEMQHRAAAVQQRRPASRARHHRGHQGHRHRGEGSRRRRDRVSAAKKAGRVCNRGWFQRQTVNFGKHENFRGGAGSQIPTANPTLFGEELEHKQKTKSPKKGVVSEFAGNQGGIAAKRENAEIHRKAVQNKFRKQARQRGLKKKQPGIFFQNSEFGRQGEFLADQKKPEPASAVQNFAVPEKQPQKFAEFAKLEKPETRENCENQRKLDQKEKEANDDSSRVRQQKKRRFLPEQFPISNPEQRLTPIQKSQNRRFQDFKQNNRKNKKAKKGDREFEGEKYQRFGFETNRAGFEKKAKHAQTRFGKQPNN